MPRADFPGSPAVNYNVHPGNTLSHQVRRLIHVGGDVVLLHDRLLLVHAVSLRGLSIWSKRGIRFLILRNIYWVIANLILCALWLGYRECSSVYCLRRQQHQPKESKEISTEYSILLLYSVIACRVINFVRMIAWFSLAGSFSHCTHWRSFLFASRGVRHLLMYHLLLWDAWRVGLILRVLSYAPRLLLGIGLYKRLRKALQCPTNRSPGLRSRSINLLLHHYKMRVIPRDVQARWHCNSDGPFFFHSRFLTSCRNERLCL